MKIANAASNLTGQDWSKNLNAIFKAIDQAAEQEAHIICFGELTITSADCGDNFQYTDNQKTREFLQYVADYAASKSIKVSIGHPWYFADKNIKNTAQKARQKDPKFNRRDLPFVVQTWLENGQITAMSAKTTLDMDAEQRDDRHFQMWRLGEVIHVNIPGMGYFSQNSEEHTFVTEKKIPFGNPVISTVIDGECITIAQVIGNNAMTQGKIAEDEKMADVILNPHAGSPVLLETQEKIDKAKINNVKCDQILVSSNNAGNAGGESAKNGNGFIAVNGVKTVETRWAGFDDVYVTTNQERFKFNNLALEMLTNAQWLLDYLSHSKLSSIIQAFSGGFSSTYNAAKIRVMVEAVVKELGIDGFKEKMGGVYKDKNCQTINDIMKILLTCVYFSDECTTREEYQDAKDLVEGLGGTFKVYDIQPEVNALIDFYKEKDEGFRRACEDKNPAPKDRDHIKKVIANIKDRVRVMWTSEISNLQPGSVGISNANLDKLCLNEAVYGGNLHGGQLALGAHEWRDAQTQNLKRLSKDALKNSEQLLVKLLAKEEQKQTQLTSEGKLTAEQVHHIFHYMLYAEAKKYHDDSIGGLQEKPLGRKNNPSEVFEQCYGSSAFSGESVELVYQKIKHCYQSWAEAQVKLHSMPLSPNYNHQAVNHDNGLRTPNINGFHRQELAHLAIKLLCDMDKRKVDKAMDENGAVENQNNIVGNSKKHINLKIATAACNQTGNDWGRNLKNIRAAIDKAVADGADLLCFQELVLSGYDCDDMFKYINNQKIYELLKPIAEYAVLKNPNLIISLGHPWKLEEREKAPHDETKPYNVQTLISGGKIIAMSAKKYLYDYSRGHERRHFEEWDDEKAGEGNDGVIKINFPDKDDPTAVIIPFGSPVVNVKQGEISINLFHSICEESWIGSAFDKGNSDIFGQDNPLARKSKNHTITVCINPNASPPAAGKWEQSRIVAKENSKYCEAFVHTNFLGTESLSMVGFGTTMIAQHEQIISEGPILSTKDIIYSSHVVKVKTVEQAKLENDYPPEYNPHKTINHTFRPEKLYTPGKNNQLIESTHWLKILEKQLLEAENVYAIDSAEYNAIKAQINLEAELRSETLWLFDYMRKNKVRGFTQALSGGADSAYNAVKLRLMVQLVLQERGLDEFLEELHYPEDEKATIKILWAETGLASNTKNIIIINPETKQPETKAQKVIQLVVNQIMGGMLTSIYLGTENSSEGTKRAARTLIEGGLDVKEGEIVVYSGIGGKYSEATIQPLLNEYLLSFSDIQPITMTEKKHAAVLAKLNEFFKLHPGSLEKKYNQYKPADAPESQWPKDYDDAHPVPIQETTETEGAFKRRVLAAQELKNQARKEREKKLLEIIEAHFKSEVQAILGENFTINGTILSPINPAHGLTIENMQARIREVIILMMTDFERKKGFSNPNLNEAVRGYTTFLGDLHSGHLAANGHKHKYEQLEQMRLLYEKGLHGLPPVNSLHYVLNNKPSAELQPHDESDAVAQFDEDAMKCSYEQNRTIAHEMFGNYSEENPVRKKTPIEVFEALKKSPLFTGKSIAELHEVLLTAYKAWAQTQYKLRASPPSMTFSDLHYGDHKKSMQTPCVNAHHAPELAQLTLYCIDIMAKEKGASFDKLTGYSLTACAKRVLVDKKFSEKLEGAMWTYSHVDKLGTGRERNLEVLYKKIETTKGYMSPLFDSKTNVVEKAYKASLENCVCSEKIKKAAKRQKMLENSTYFFSENAEKKSVEKNCSFSSDRSRMKHGN